MKCKYCFANFSHIKRALSKEDWFEIIRQLTDVGMKKVNLVGGEPTLCPFLGDLITYSKGKGLITGIVSNGTGITPHFIKKYGKFIDWIGISLDSGNELTQLKLGRGNGTYVSDSIQKTKIIKKAGIKLKINSVITRWNLNEDISKVIKLIDPDRWKVFQVLMIRGQNQKKSEELGISNLEFMKFIRNHEILNPIAEDNDKMLESYIMVDPLGRFYQNSRNFYTYSEPILKVGVSRAFNQVIFNHLKFVERGGIYAF